MSSNSSVLGRDLSKSQKKNARKKLVKKLESPASLQLARAANQLKSLARPSNLPSVSGRGGYWGELLGTLVGSKFGPTAGAMGGSLGSRLGDWLSDKAKSIIRGRGEYKDAMIPDTTNIVANSFLASTPTPKISNVGEAFVYRQCGFVANVFSTVDFTIQGFKINMTNRELFPWFGRQARGYQQGEFEGLMYHYIPRVSPLKNNSSGAVIFGTNYNANRPNFQSKVEMEQSDYCSTCTPYQSMFHPIECAPNQTSIPVLYCLPQNGLVPAGEDPKTYFLGNFQVATEGMDTVGELIGEIWVSLECKMYKTVLSQNDDADILTDRYFGVSNAVATDDFLENSVALAKGVGSTLGGVWLNGTYTFPASIVSGQYQVSIATVPGLAWSAAGEIDVIVAGMSRRAIWPDAGALDTVLEIKNPVPTLPDIHACYLAVFNITSASASIHFNFSSVITNDIRYTLLVTQVNQGINFGPI